MIFKENDVIISINDINDDIPKGTEGVIMTILEENKWFLVEFIDDNGDTIGEGMDTVNVQDIKKLENSMANLELIKKAIEKIDNKIFININASDLSVENWKDLISYLNNTYKINFKENVSNQEYEKIDYDLLLNFWNGETENGYMATIHLETILVNCFFNVVNYLEFDVLYKDVVNNENLKKIIDFVSSMSDVVDKPFYLEEDNYSTENRLVEIYKSKILVLKAL